MKTLKDMTTEELKDYSRRMSNLNKNRQDYRPCDRIF